MLALVLALGVATAAPPQAPPIRIIIDRHGMNLRASVCRAGVITASGPGAISLLRPQDRAEVKRRRLGDLPKAHKEIAVERTVDGCPAPLIVSYDVEGDGHFAPGEGK